MLPCKDSTAHFVEHTLLLNMSSNSSLQWMHFARTNKINMQLLVLSKDTIIDQISFLLWTLHLQFLSLHFKSFQYQFLLWLIDRLSKEAVKSYKMCNMAHALAMIPMGITDPTFVKLLPMNLVTRCNVQIYIFLQVFSQIRSFRYRVLERKYLIVNYSVYRSSKIIKQNIVSRIWRIYV